MDAIRDKHNFVPLDAHGLAVGLKEGLMGNSDFLMAEHELRSSASASRRTLIDLDDILPNNSTSTNVQVSS
jgi:hypothetical protein